jgi:hypothetical protein
MLYRLLGMAVWKGGKLYLRRKYGGRTPSRLVTALGGVLVVGAGAALFAARHGNGDSS